MHLLHFPNDRCRSPFTQLDDTNCKSCERHSKHSPLPPDDLIPLIRTFITDSPKLKPSCGHLRFLHNVHLYLLTHADTITHQGTSIAQRLSLLPPNVCDLAWGFVLDVESRGAVVYGSRQDTNGIGGTRRDWSDRKVPVKHKRETMTSKLGRRPSC
jgi:hypothetical protein